MANGEPFIKDLFTGRENCIEAMPLIENLKAESLTADRAYDIDKIEWQIVES